MKRKSLISLLLAMVFGLAMISLSACEKPHEHNYNWEITAPTQTQTGFAKKVCSTCQEGQDGHEITVTLPILTDAGYEIGRNTATCELPGELNYSITVNGEKIDFAISTDKKGHNFGNLIEEEVATIYSIGVKQHYYCEDCGGYFNQNKLSVSPESLIIPQLWSSNADYHWLLIEGGSGQAEKANHSYDSGVVTKEPTFVEKGVRTFTCSVCDYKVLEDIPKLETHVCVPSETLYYDSNIHYHKCESCGDIFDADMHSLDGGVITTPPTYKNMGVLTTSCSGCNYKKTQNLHRCGEDGNGNLILAFSQNQTITTSQEFLSGVCVVASEQTSVIIDTNSKSYEGGAFTHRLKFNDAMTEDGRYLSITLTKKSQVDVYAMSSRSVGNAFLAVFNSLNDISSSSAIQVFEANPVLNCYSITLEPGTYYFGSLENQDSCFINVYGVMVNVVN